MSITAKQAREALDNMDDYARMDAGVDAIGPRKVLEDYITETDRQLAAKDAELERLRAECDELCKHLERVERDTEILKRLRDLAMLHTVKARIPECGIFGEIAQDLDFILGGAP